MRDRPVILHLDMDAFYAAVEQRDKPSLRGKPVVVGGTGPRGVVSTASYEARRFGIHSAMPTGQARRRCPNAAFLFPRFAAYRLASDVVMAALAELSPLVEPLSLDEAFVDLSGRADATGGRATQAELGTDAVRRIAVELKGTITRRTGLAASVGAGTSKLVAKIASDLDKPDGLLVVPPGDELAMLHGLPVTRLWGVGPATAQRLARLGITTVAGLAAVPREELVAAVGSSVGQGLAAQAAAQDDRPVVPDRETRSVGVEDTFESDVVDAQRLRRELDLMATRTTRRLASTGMSARTVTVKVRMHDFRTVTRSLTVAGGVGDESVLRRIGRALLDDVDVTGGVRLLGLSVSGLSDQVQAELPYQLPPGQLRADPALGPDHPADPTSAELATGGRDFRSGADVQHAEHGRGWVQGSGLGRVTVRFETAHSGPGPVRTFRGDDEMLVPADPAEFTPRC